MAARMTKPEIMHKILGMLLTELRCFWCKSENLKSLGFVDFGSNNIEIEELICSDCHRITRYPLQNRNKQLRENIHALSESND